MNEVESDTDNSKKVENNQADSNNEGNKDGENKEASTNGANETLESASDFDADGLEKQLEEANKKAAIYWDQLLRLKADMDNLRKRAARDLEDAHKFGLDRFIKDLLPVCDSLELGLQAASEDNADLVKIKEGVELTLQSFMSVLEKSGVSAIRPKQGDKLDPELHQVMAMHEDADAKPNTIVTVIQKGYSLNERLVRPAMVVVAKKPQTETPQTEKEAKKSGYDDQESGTNIDEKA